MRGGRLGNHRLTPSHSSKRERKSGRRGFAGVARADPRARAETRQSAFAFSVIAASSFLMSAGDSCGRSSLTVSLLSFAVSANGGR